MDFQPTISTLSRPYLDEAYAPCAVASTHEHAERTRVLVAHAAQFVAVVGAAAHVVCEARTPGDVGRGHVLKVCSL